MPAPTESSSTTPATAAEIPQLAELGPALSFIETQFPVSKLSKESYRERKSPSQTLTSLGKWWGRKPLVLCRATILGLLMPATSDPTRDREVFLKLMTMDDDGMLRRKSKSIPQKVLFQRLPPRDRQTYFSPESTENKATFKKGLDRAAKDRLQRRVFLSMSYDERLDYCDRPEHIDGPSSASWSTINQHLGTNASSIPALVQQLSERRFGHRARVGDAFCGGGSVPFEAARIGCDAYGADLNPVAALLSWASCAIVGGSAEASDHAANAQRSVFDRVEEQFAAWGIELREPNPETGRRWRADAYLYCAEAPCPECGWRIPLAPSWVIAEKTNVIARLVPDSKLRRFDFEIASHVNKDDLASARAGTVSDSELVCPHCRNRTPIKVVRGDGRGTFGDSKSLLRGWEKLDVVARPDDIISERLYCIRWLDRWTEIVVNSRGDEVEKTLTERHYLAPTHEDMEREHQVVDLLMARLNQWQAAGVIPSRAIEPGWETTRLGRERGWTYWHHLFHPRQLLLHGLLMEQSGSALPDNDRVGRIACLLAASYLCNWNSRLCSWIPNLARSGGIGATAQTFYNQALNTFFNYGVRPTVVVRDTFCQSYPAYAVNSEWTIRPADARDIPQTCDLWLTDPPYADAVNYDELGEFFLAWQEKKLLDLFPEWYTDSRRALAVRSKGGDFSKSMVDCYRAMADKMPTNGHQVVMFTHQDAAVWADLAMILWAAGMSVTAAWCIATEIEAGGYKKGNYVQGTVLLVLRKRGDDASAFLDEVYQDVEQEVRKQLDAMLALDDRDDPNFADTDYQLAAYAAALRVLTGRPIEDIDVLYELTKARARDEKSKVEELIENAVRIACDHLVPRGIEAHFWKLMAPAERFYLKGIEIESHGEYRGGVYQELARGFRLDEYTPMLANTKANETRLKTANEFGRRELGSDGFGSTLVRHALFSIYKTTQTESTREGLQWLHDEMNAYWASRERLIAIFEFVAAVGKNASMEHWHGDAHAAELMAGAVRNDHV